MLNIPVNRVPFLPGPRELRFQQSSRGTCRRAGFRYICIVDDVIRRPGVPSSVLNIAEMELRKLTR